MNSSIDKYFFYQSRNISVGSLWSEWDQLRCERGWQGASPGARRAPFASCVTAAAAAAESSSSSSSSSDGGPQATLCHIDFTGSLTRPTRSPPRNVSHMPPLLSSLVSRLSVSPFSLSSRSASNGVDSPPLLLYTSPPPFSLSFCSFWPSDSLAKPFRGLYVCFHRVDARETDLPNVRRTLKFPRVQGKFSPLYRVRKKER